MKRIITQNHTECTVLEPHVLPKLIPQFVCYSYIATPAQSEITKAYRTYIMIAMIFIQGCLQTVWTILSMQL